MRHHPLHPRMHLVEIAEPLDQGRAFGNHQPDHRPVPREADPEVPEHLQHRCGGQARMGGDRADQPTGQIVVTGDPALELDAGKPGLRADAVSGALAMGAEDECLRPVVHQSVHRRSCIFAGKADGDILTPSSQRRAAPRNRGKTAGRSAPGAGAPGEGGPRI